MKTDMSYLDLQMMRIDGYNQMAGNLEYIDCPICKNKGYIAKLDEDGNEVMATCKCMVKRNALKQIEKSGLASQIKTLTFDNYQANMDWQARHKQACIEYLHGNNWLYYGGQSGGGKTHLCTAICGKLLMRGIAVRYIRWREDSTKLKSLLDDALAYNEALDNLKTAKVLYIDDFFKGKPTDADIKLAFDLIDYRYINNMQTIISSEITLKDLALIDEAIAGRIAEKAGRYVFRISKAINNNYRQRSV